MTQTPKTVDFQTAVAVTIVKSGKSIAEIAESLGCPKPSVIAMMVAGMVNLPLNRAADLARACEADPSELIALALVECEDDGDRTLLEGLRYSRR